jgi:hypothetical protein
MYMFPVAHDIYAVVPYRLWWAPWRWNLQVYWWTETNNITHPKPVATNITKAECIGLMKLLGYEQEIKC